MNAMAPELHHPFARRTRWNLDENSLSRTLATLRATRTSILDLTRSNPTESGFEYNQEKIQDAVGQSEILHYVPDPRGMARARESVSGYYADLQSPVSVATAIHRFARGLMRSRGPMGGGTACRVLPQLGQNSKPALG